MVVAWRLLNLTLAPALPIMKPNLPSELVAWLRDKRKQQALHDLVENRLIQILKVVAPGFLPVKEIQGLPGGRNDLMLFDFRGRKVVFEVFASKSQVSRDLRILDLTKADKKVAVIIDPEVDSGVWERFHRENPENNYSWLLISELFDNNTIGSTALKLRELLLGDDEAFFQRLLRERMPRADFFEVCRKEGIEILRDDDLANKTVTVEKVFMMLVFARLQKAGVDKRHTVKLLKWLSNKALLDHISMKFALGFNLFLYTDLSENMAVYSDMELVEWIQAYHAIDTPVILLSLTNLMNYLFGECMKREQEHRKPPIRFTIGHSSMFEEPEGRLVTLSLPKNTSRIMVFRPANYEDPESKPLAYEEIINMIEIV